MTTETENAIAIAVLQEQVGGLREQQKAHNESTQNRFDKLEEKIDELTAVMNRGKGAYAASLAAAGIIGAGFLKGIDLLAGYFHR